jgi:hypothetical protein
VFKITQPKAWLLAPALGCAVNLKRLPVAVPEHLAPWARTGSRERLVTD